MSLSPAALTLHARVIGRSLVQAGVRTVVLSPGSRSTPFVLAFAEEADLSLIDVVDERVAAFVALGIARDKGLPVAVLCTSGTAPAHWYPAVIEASLSNLPLLLLSADRPTELFASGAAQTIDQTKLFGDFVRFFADLGDPAGIESQLKGVRRLVSQAVGLARGPIAGPVHLNLRARKPLELVPLEGEDARLLERVLAAPLPLGQSSLSFSREALSAAQQALSSAKRPLVFAGPLPLDCAGTAQGILDLLSRAGLPLFAEATSHLRFATHPHPRLTHIDRALSQLPSDLRPDLVIQLGALPTSSALERWLSSAQAPARVVLGAPGFHDPYGNATSVLIGPPLEALQAALSSFDGLRDPSFFDALISLDRKLSSATLSQVRAHGFGEHRLASLLVEALDSETTLLVGNSLPIRMLDRATLNIGPGRVASQRGANGIDGLLSQAIGISLSSKAPVCAYIGDLSALHDIGSLASAHLASSPLLIVIVVNGGGRIFETLPIGTSSLHAKQLPHFTTDTAVDFEHLARAFGISFARATDDLSFVRAVQQSLSQVGPTLVAAEVPPHDARDVERELNELVSRTLPPH